MNRRLLPRSGLLAAYLLSVGPALDAQEVGFSLVRGESDHVEFPSPDGFRASVLIGLTSSFTVRLGLTRITDETTKVGTVCQVYSPRIECNPEMTNTSISLSGLRGGLMWTHWFGDYIRVGVGGGGSFNQVSVEATGVSGQRADFLDPAGGQLGAFGRISAAVAPYPAIPFRITGGLAAHWVNFHVCSGEDPPQYDPLCDPTTFREVEVGISYSFPRR